MSARLEPGDVLAEKFRLVRVLGEGGMGVVYEAEHLALGEAVAIKVLHGDADGERQTQRLLREARLAARIKSENVARVTDFGVSQQGSPFLVMELARGPSLARVLRDRGALDVALAARYALEICVALAEAHALGIVHRDVKPSNVIVIKRRDGSELVKVLDFGVAKQMASDGSLTASAGLLGSPNYMSPEQVRDARSVDERSDVWSVGVLLYELVTARLPFEAFTAPGVLAAITADDPVSPRSYRAELSPELEAVILRCLARDRSERYPRVVELADALAPHTPEGAGLAARVRALRESEHEPAQPHAEPAPSPADADETDATQNATATSARASLPPTLAARPTRRRSIAVGAAALGVLGLVALGLLRSPANSDHPVAAAPGSAPPVPSPATEPAMLPPLTSASGSPEASSPEFLVASADPRDAAARAPPKPQPPPRTAATTKATTMGPAASSPATPEPTPKGDLEFGYRK